MIGRPFHCMQIRDICLFVKKRVPYVVLLVFKSPRPGMLIVFSVVSSRCLDNQTTFQRMLHWFRRPTSRTTFHAHFDIKLASSLFTSVTSSVDFRCPESEDSRLVRLHIQNMGILA